MYYDPNATVLRGRPETWVRGCWNRWAHAQCFLPELMRPVLPGGIGFHRASVQARMLDFWWRGKRRVFAHQPHGRACTFAGCSIKTVTQVGGGYISK